MKIAFIVQVLYYFNQSEIYYENPGELLDDLK